MKRFAVTVLVSGALFFTLFSAESYLAKVCYKISDELEICAEYIKNQNYTSAAAQGDRLKECWRKNEMLMRVVSGDDTSLFIGSDIDIMLESIGDKNYAYALMTIRECQRFLQDKIVEGKLSIDNIL